MLYEITNQNKSERLIINYRDQERRRTISIRKSLIKDPGKGIFFGKERELVLKGTALNLWEGIRIDALQYFKRNKILQWKRNNGYPSRHLLSS